MKIEAVIKSNITLSLSKNTVLNIMYTQNVLAEKFSEILKRYDLSSEQFNVLGILRDQESIPANMHAIQERMIAKTSNTTRLVDKLLLKGLVTREVCSKNRRKIEVSITQKGHELLNKIDPSVAIYEEKFANNLTSNELKDLNYLLEKYRTIRY